MIDELNCDEHGWQVIRTGPMSSAMKVALLANLIFLNRVRASL